MYLLVQAPLRVQGVARPPVWMCSCVCVRVCVFVCAWGGGGGAPKPVLRMHNVWAGAVVFCVCLKRGGVVVQWCTRHMISARHFYHRCGPRCLPQVVLDEPYDSQFPASALQLKFSYDDNGVRKVRPMAPGCLSFRELDRVRVARGAWVPTRPPCVFVTVPTRLATIPRLIPSLRVPSRTCCCCCKAL